MSNLTLALAILGGLVLAAVIGYDALRSRRNAPRQPDAADGDPADAQRAPSDDGYEPVMHVDPRQVPTNDRHEPLFDPDLPAPGTLPVPTGERRGGLDPLIDVIAPISLDGLASGDAAIAAMPPTRRAGSKPVAIEGLNEHSRQWEPPVPGQRYGAFQVGVQLANRTGALNEIEYSNSW